MQAENILAKNISAAGRKSSYDAACKRLLANKIILAWIMNPPENRRNTITRYSIHEENIVGNVHEIPQNYDLLSAIIICLSDSEQEADGGVLKLLEVLLSPTREAAEKKQILQDDFHIEMTRKLEKEVSIMCNLSKGIEEIGIREGKREGKKEGILFSIQSLMETMNFTMEEAMNALKIPKTEQEQYTKKLKQK